MATEIRVPTLGESVTEATIGKWFKKAGDAVAVDEPVVELETDKVTIEVPAPATGVLAEITVAEGETVGVGALLGNISEGAGAAPAKKEEPKAEAPAPAKAEPAKTAEGAPAPAAASGKTDMPPSPAATRVLAEAGVSADQVSGSGKRGQVLKPDALDAVARGVTALAPAAAPAAVRAPSSEEDAGREERVKMTRLRQTIARLL
jgi:2-oxoglutarate dehydrogenase E2 component (dihydrolipoamide succinyltransferase)